MNTQNIQLAREYYQGEQNSIYLYEVLAEIEKNEHLAEVYRRMAAVERKHAAQWSRKLEDAGVPTPPLQLTWRTRVLASLGRKFGPDLVLPGMQAMEKDGSQGYAAQADGGQMAMEEKSHAFIIDQVRRAARGGMEGGALAQLEGRHRSSGGNALRAAVLGANDGLVSNLSLVMGVAGASMEGRGVLIAGMAGLLAGACSMALGEWLSVQSSRELYAHQIEIETREVEQSPEEEEEELALIYEARGLTAEQAALLARQIMSKRGSAVETLVREELGVNPDDLGGSAWEAAITSFILFSLGAVIPVAPFIFLTGLAAVGWSVALSAAGLFLIGAAITLFTGKPVLYSGMRMVIFGLIAAGITFGVGKIIGVSIGG